MVTPVLVKKLPIFSAVLGEAGAVEVGAIKTGFELAAFGEEVRAVERGTEEAGVSKNSGFKLEL